MMKRLRPVIGAVLVGCFLAFAIFRVVEEHTLEAPKGNAVAIQLGVFKNLEAAEKLKQSHGGEIFETEGVYRVYYSILSTDDNIEFVTKYLQDSGINYYLKPMNITKEALKEGKEYERVMSKSRLDVRMSINEELLSMYKEVV